MEIALIVVAAVLLVWDATSGNVNLHVAVWGPLVLAGAAVLQLVHPGSALFPLVLCAGFGMTFVASLQARMPGRPDAGRSAPRWVRRQVEARSDGHAGRHRADDKDET